MRNLLLATVATLTLAAAPALAESLLSGGAKVGGGGDVGVSADAGGSGAAAAAGTAVDADANTTIDTGAAADVATGAGETVDGAVDAGASTAVETAAGAESGVQGALEGAQLIGRTVIDANGEAVGEVSNAVLAADGSTVTQVIVEHGGFLGIGAREVAVDAAQVDTKADAEGAVHLRGMTAADLDLMTEFKAEASTRLLNPS
jgi:sporulation protein YlmC with PRC-barrel domain